MAENKIWHLPYTAEQIEAAMGKLVELAGKVESTASGNIHVLDIGAAEFDPTAMDFSQYAAGDVILVVSDAVVEEAVQGGAGGT